MDWDAGRTGRAGQMHPQKGSKWAPFTHLCALSGPGINFGKPRFRHGRGRKVIGPEGTQANYGHTALHDQTTQYDTATHHGARHNITRHDTTRHDTTRHDTTRHGNNITRHATTSHDTTRHGTTRPQHHTTGHARTRRSAEDKETSIEGLGLCPCGNTCPSAQVRTIFGGTG